ncbi:MAG: hypothetical protein IIX99_03715 [Oscillospiraceae bacterium]|nr:hypothetical protein [Oscillospiraceae bacterium]
MLQKGPFRAILRQKATAGVSLAVAFFLVLYRKLLFLKCFAVLRQRFFSHRRFEAAGILCVFQGKSKAWGKRSEQNQILSYGTPPKQSFFIEIL